VSGYLPNEKKTYSNTNMHYFIISHSPYAIFVLQRHFILTFILFYAILDDGNWSFLADRGSPSAKNYLDILSGPLSPQSLSAGLLLLREIREIGENKPFSRKSGKIMGNLAQGKLRENSGKTHTMSTQ